MKNGLLEAKQFSVEEKKHKVSQIEGMIEEFSRMADDLQEQIDVEQEKSGISDVNHYAYPTFARAAVQRRENLLVSIKSLNDQLDGARKELNDAHSAMKRVEERASHNDSKRLR